MLAFPLCHHVLRTTGVRWRWIWNAVALFAAAALVWFVPRFVATRSPGEKDFGAGILSIVALFVSPLCALLGLIYLGATVLEYRIQRR